MLEYPRAITGRAGLDSIKNGATAVLERCTVDGRTQGGIAKNIGMYHLCHRNGLFQGICLPG